MNAYRNWKSGPLAALAFAVLSSPATVAIAQEVTEQNVVERIATMKSAQDHEAIAAFFEAQAAAAGEKVKEHEAMLGKYNRPSSSISQIMRDHCGELIGDYRKAQASYEELAKEHEKLAKKAASEP